MQKQVPKKKAASKGRLVRDEEVWILRVALGNDAVWVRYASMQEAAEAVKEASNSTADISNIVKHLIRKMKEIPANSKRARCYLGFVWTDDESVSRKDETRAARTAIAEFGEGCWILHEFNGAKWQYFENTSAAAEEVKKVSGYQGQAVRLRLNVSTRWSHFVHFSAGNVVVTTPHTDANSIQKDNHQLSTQFKKTKRGPAFRAI